MIIIDKEFKGFFDKLKKMFLYPEVKAVYIFRRIQHYEKSKKFFLKCIYRYKWLRLRKKGYQISIDTTIGKGLSLLHHGTRQIVGRVIIGSNCTIGINVVIGYGYKDNQYYAPIIGNRVYIGHNSCIVGKVVIGDDVLIAPNAFVNKDVPSNSVVIGNNIVISKNEASKPYLNLGA